MQTDSGATAPAYTPDTFSAEDSLGRLIRDVSTRLLSALDGEMAPLGITGAQWVVLMRVANGGPGIAAAELCRFLRYDTGSMTRMLDRLEEKGLIRRVQSCCDRRVTQLELTEAGWELFPLLPLAAIKVLNAHLKGFTPEELERFKDFLNRMLANSEHPA